jgi:hypothetical protein
MDRERFSNPRISGMKLRGIFVLGRCGEIQNRLDAGSLRGYRS